MLCVCEPSHHSVCGGFFMSFSSIRVSFMFVNHSTSKIQIIIVMKEEILKYLRTDRSYAAGVVLIIKYSTRLALKKQCNNHPQSDHMVGLVNEELRELAGISRDELEDIMLRPIAKSSPVNQVNESAAPEDPTEVKASEAGAPVATPTEKKASRKK